MKKLLTVAMVFALTLLVSVPVFAKAENKPVAPAEKTTGGVGYDAYGLHRYAEFNAFENADECSTGWLVNENNTINIPWNSTVYTYALTLSQYGETLTGTLYEQYLNPDQTLDVEGTIVNNIVTLTVEYPGAYWGTRTFVGTLDPDTGEVSGTWSDSGTGNGSGDWSTELQFASMSVNGCEGKGNFHYSDVNGNWYMAKVQYANVEGDEAWFGALVNDASDQSWLGNWVFVKTFDGGEPATGVDQVWGSFTDEDGAKYGVATMSEPNDGPFTVTEGNLQVHTY